MRLLRAVYYVLINGKVLFHLVFFFIKFKYINEYTYYLRSILNPAHKLRQRMLHFVQTLQHYMFYEVIEPNWLKFVENVEKVSDSIFRPE